MNENRDRLLAKLKAEGGAARALSIGAQLVDPGPSLRTEMAKQFCDTLLTMATAADKHEEIAKGAVMLADALLAELGKPTKDAQAAEVAHHPV